MQWMVYFYSKHIDFICPISKIAPQLDHNDYGDIKLSIAFFVWVEIIPFFSFLDKSEKWHQLLHSILQSFPLKKISPGQDLDRQSITLVQVYNDGFYSMSCTQNRPSLSLPQPWASEKVDSLVTTRVNTVTWQGQTYWAVFLCLKNFLLRSFIALCNLSCHPTRASRWFLWRIVSIICSWCFCKWIGGCWHCSKHQPSSFCIG